MHVMEPGCCTYLYSAGHQIHVKRGDKSRWMEICMCWMEETANFPWACKKRTQKKKSRFCVTWDAYSMLSGYASALYHRVCLL